MHSEGGEVVCGSRNNDALRRASRPRYFLTIDAGSGRVHDNNSDSPTVRNSKVPMQLERARQTGLAAGVSPGALGSPGTIESQLSSLRIGPLIRDQRWDPFTPC